MSIVKEALHVCAAQSVIVCREEEQKKVLDFCKSCIQEDKASSLYVCGCPGTGKTLSLEKVKVNLLDWATEIFNLGIDTSRFKMSTFGDVYRSKLHDCLNDIVQTSTVDAFYNHFEAIKELVSSSHPWLPEVYFADRFIYGLRSDIQPYVINYQPCTVFDARHLALIYEYSLQKGRQQVNNIDNVITLGSNLEASTVECLEIESSSYNLDGGNNLAEDLNVSVDGASTPMASDVHDMIVRLDSDLPEVKEGVYNSNGEYEKHFSTNFQRIEFSQHKAAIKTKATFNSQGRVLEDKESRAVILAVQRSERYSSAEYSTIVLVDASDIVVPLPIFELQHYNFSWEPGPLSVASKLRTHRGPDLAIEMTVSSKAVMEGPHKVNMSSVVIFTVDIFKDLGIATYPGEELKSIVEKELRVLADNTDSKASFCVYMVDNPNSYPKLCSSNSVNESLAYYYRVIRSKLSCVPLTMLRLLLYELQKGVYEYLLQSQTASHSERYEPSDDVHFIEATKEQDSNQNFFRHYWHDTGWILPIGSDTNSWTKTQGHLRYILVQATGSFTGVSQFLSPQQEEHHISIYSYYPKLAVCSFDLGVKNKEVWEQDSDKYFTASCLAMLSIHIAESQIQLLSVTPLHKTTLFLVLASLSSACASMQAIPIIVGGTVSILQYDTVDKSSVDKLMSTRGVLFLSIIETLQCESVRYIFNGAMLIDSMPIYMFREVLYSGYSNRSIGDLHCAKTTIRAGVARWRAKSKPNTWKGENSAHCDIPLHNSNKQTVERFCCMDLSPTNLEVNIVSVKHSFSPILLEHHRVKHELISLGGAIRMNLFYDVLGIIEVRTIFFMRYISFLDIICSIMSTKPLDASKCLDSESFFLLMGPLPVSHKSLHCKEHPTEQSRTTYTQPVCMWSSKLFSHLIHGVYGRISTYNQSHWRFLLGKDYPPKETIPLPEAVTVSEVDPTVFVKFNLQVSIVITVTKVYGDPSTRSVAFQFRILQALRGIWVFDLGVGCLISSSFKFRVLDFHSQCANIAMDSLITRAKVALPHTLIALGTQLIAVHTVSRLLLTIWCYNPCLGLSKICHNIEHGLRVIIVTSVGLRDIDLPSWCDFLILGRMAWYSRVCKVYYDDLYSFPAFCLDTLSSSDFGAILRRQNVPCEISTIADYLVVCFCDRGPVDGGTLVHSLWGIAWTFKSLNLPYLSSHMILEDKNLLLRGGECQDINDEYFAYKSD